MGATTESIREAVEDYFKVEGLKWVPFDENDIARAMFGVKCKFGHATVFFHAQDDRLLIRAMIPLEADEDTRLAAAEYLLRANYGMRNGGFDFDFRDGEISFRFPIYCGEEVDAPTHEQIDYAVNTCILTIQRYGDGLARVIYGIESAKESIAKIEGKRVED